MAMDILFFIIFLIFPMQKLLEHPFIQGTLKECEGKKESLQCILVTFN